MQLTSEEESAIKTLRREYGAFLVRAAASPADHAMEAVFYALSVVDKIDLHYRTQRLEEQTNKLIKDIDGQMSPMDMLQHYTPPDRVINGKICSR